MEKNMPVLPTILLLFYAIYSPTVLKTDSSNTEIITIMANMG